MTKYLVFAAVFAALLISLSASSTSPGIVHKAAVVKQDPPAMSIVRLHTTTGQFFCSGVVVGKSTILTAAHCVDGNEGPYEVRTHRNESIGTYAILAGANFRADYAVLRGDFRKFPALTAIVDPVTIVAMLKDQKRLIISCGFAWSGELYCAALRKRFQYDFMFAGDGTLYPGMSGGPVIDITSGHVIGVNSAVSGVMTLIAPIIEIYRSTEVNPE